MFYFLLSFVLSFLFYIYQVVQMVKNPPAMQETWAQSLGWEDPLEEGMATHSSIFAWRILMDRGAWRATVHGVAKSPDTTEWLSTQEKCLTLSKVLMLKWIRPIYKFKLIPNPVFIPLHPTSSSVPWASPAADQVAQLFYEKNCHVNGEYWI